MHTGLASPGAVSRDAHLAGFPPPSMGLASHGVRSPWWPERSADFPEGQGDRGEGIANPRLNRGSRETAYKSGDRLLDFSRRGNRRQPTQAPGADRTADRPFGPASVPSRRQSSGPVKFSSPAIGGRSTGAVSKNPPRVVRCFGHPILAAPDVYPTGSPPRPAPAADAPWLRGSFVDSEFALGLSIVPDA